MRGTYGGFALLMKLSHDPRFSAGFGAASTAALPALPCGSNEPGSIGAFRPIFVGLDSDSARKSGVVVGCVRNDRLYTCRWSNTLEKGSRDEEWLPTTSLHA